MNCSAFSHLNTKYNLHGILKDIINNTFLFNQCHVVNHLLKKIIYLMTMGDTNKPRMDQVLYYVYKIDENMEENYPKLNNTDILTPEGHQVTEFTGDDELDQDVLDSGAYDEYYSYGEEYCGGGSGKESELDDDDVVTETQEHVLDSRSNFGCVLKIWSHLCLKLTNDATITA